MSSENPGPIVSREAGTNVTNKRFVVEAGENVVNRASVSGSKIDGVVAMISTGFTGTAIAAGEGVPVCKSGVIIMEAGEAVDSDVEVMTDNVGRPVAFDDDPAHYAVGISRTASTGAGKDIAVELYAIAAQHAGEAVS